jgi:short-subunit dehydrogenase
MKTEWTTANIPSQVGRRALITGANSGIGFEAALALARGGAELILPARTQAKADDAAARIRELVPNAQLHPEILDLAVQASITVRKHPKMFQLWGLSLGQKSYYDPRKQ